MGRGMENLGGLDGGTPAAFTLDPDPLALGASASATAELSASRLAGVRVSLDGDIAAVASVATPLGWDGGGCGDGVGEGLEITVTRTGGTAGQAYGGDLVVLDDTGAETRFSVSLEVPLALSLIAQQQGWDYIWAMDTAGTSQPNRGTGGVNPLILTRARVTTTQAGALGALDASTTSDRGVSDTAISVGTGAASMVLALDVSVLSGYGVVFQFGSAVGHKGTLYTDGSLLSLATSGGSQVMNLGSLTTGVWLIALSYAGGNPGPVTGWMRKVGASRLTATGSIAASSATAQKITVAGNANSVRGSYFFAAVRTGSTMTQSEFDALYASMT